MRSINQLNYNLPHVFNCPKCKKTLPCDCGYELEYKNNILQLTDLPDIKIEEDEANKYIGYEHIGEAYSGYDGKVKINDRDLAIAKMIKTENPEALLLDLGCGDGNDTIPLAINQVKVIAGDISNKMMMILQKKLKFLNIDSKNVTCVRMNAYDIPIIDNAIDVIIANGMLHLNSNPRRILEEIYRVLKPHGKFYCFEDTPGRIDNDGHFDNQVYLEITNAFYQRYYELLKARNIYPIKYSWRFDRDQVCSKLFASSYEKILELPREVKTTTLDEGFYKRMKSKGFSDQTAVPDDFHQAVFFQVDQEMMQKYGENYREVEFKFYAPDVKVKVYIK